MTIIYGVDTKKPINTVMVRDAIIACFIEAHKDVLEEMKELNKFKSENSFEEFKKLNVELTIKNFFNDVGADFNNPAKTDILKVIEQLKYFSKNYRKPKIIEKHTYLFSSFTESPPRPLRVSNLAISYPGLVF